MKLSTILIYFVFSLMIVQAFGIYDFGQWIHVNGVVHTRTFIGLATRFTSSAQTTANYQAVKDKMRQYGLDTIRLCSGDELFGSSYTWDNGDAVQWFLDNTNFAVIIDRDHTVGAGNSVTLTQEQWSSIDAHLAQMAVRWSSYGDRVLLEPINEYSNEQGDYASQMARILATFRNAGYSNWLVFNHNSGYGGYAETVGGLNDPLHKIIGGMHHYMDNAVTNPNLGKDDFNVDSAGHSLTGFPIINTEAGASIHERGQGWTQAMVDAVSTNFALMAQAGFGVLLWCDYTSDGILSNLPYYEAMGLIFPT